MADVSTLLLVAVLFFAVDGHRDSKSSDEAIDKDHWTSYFYDQPQYRYLASVFGIPRLQPSVQASDASKCYL